LLVSGAFTARFFGRRRGASKGDLQGDNKISQSLFDTANAGNYKDASTFVSDDFTAYANGYQMGSDKVDKGADLLTEVLYYYDVEPLEPPH
jgi:hypothetical protein